MTEPGWKNYAWRYTDAYEYMERVGSMPPCMVVLAVNGGVQGKETNPNLPEEPEEITQSIAEAYDAGVSNVHIHARNPDRVTDPAVNARDFYIINQMVRDACPDIVINNTTGGGLGMTMEQRICSLDANPEVASLNVTADQSRFTFKERKAPLKHPRKSFTYDDVVPFSYKNVNWFVSEMKAKGIKPEIETYHTGGAHVIRDIIANGFVDKPYFIQTVMGYQTSSWPTFDNVFQLVREFPEDTVWLCSGISKHQLPMTTFSTLLGGHVRVGMEDNIYYRRGELLDSNRQVVERTIRLIGELERDVATPAQAREMLALSPTPSVYDAHPDDAVDGVRGKKGVYKVPA